MAGNVFGLRRCTQSAFLTKIGIARLGRLNMGLGRNQRMYCCEKGATLGQAKTCLDRTGAADRCCCGVKETV